MRRIGWICMGCLALVSCHDAEQADRYAAECYRHGRELRAEGRHTEAIQCFMDAAESGTEDFVLLGRVYSNMANMCRQAERHALACELYGQSTELFRKGNDTLAVAYALNNMAWELAVQGEKSQALQLIDSAVSVCPSPAVRSKVQESRAAACLYAGENDSAVLYAQGIQDELYGNMLLAQAYVLNGQCDSAMHYAGQVAGQTDNPRYLDDIYYILAHCDSTASAPDIIALAEKRTDVQRELESFKSEMAQAVLLIRPPSQTSRRFLLCIIGLVVFIGAAAWLGWFIYRRTRQKQKVRQTILRLQQSKQFLEEIHPDDYQAFCRLVDTQLWGLATKLQKRNLSEKEVRIAVLVLLGFSYAQIADILHRAENGIGKDKYVIAKKLGSSVKGLKAALLHIACRN